LPPILQPPFSYFKLQRQEKWASADEKSHARTHAEISFERWHYPCCQTQQTETAMKNIYKKINRTKYSLGELISIVGSCARNSRETIAAMADLLDSGRVVIRKNGRARRVRVEYAR
jgi:hypothetical protein